MIRVALIKPSPAEVVQQYDRPEYPCLGLAYISAVLKANGFEVLVIDASFDGLSFNQVAARIMEFKPVILGFTAMTHEIVHVAEVAKKLKEKLPIAITVIGGAHATVAPFQTLTEFPVFDIAVIGEGEETFKEIIKALDENCNDIHHLTETISPERLTLIRGIAWRSGQKVKINEKRPFISELDLLPFPNYDHLTRKIHVYPLFSSRGCPNNCLFCCRIMGNKIRVRSPKNVVDEIKYALERFMPEKFDFADETFTFPKERSIEICDLIINQGLNQKIKWKAQSRVTLVNQKLFEKMKQAGCIAVDFGVESGNSETLKTIRKGITLDDALKAVQAAKKAGLKTGSYFILGHPYETMASALDTVNFASKLNTDSVSFGIMVPYPGTEVCEMAKRGEGGYRIISQNWSDYDKQLGNALELNDLSRGQLEKLQRKAYLTFYLKNYRLFSILRLIHSQRRLLWKMLTK
jgi:anaerobic magnesium-protoporphyrin IX monomethyl ester cyclase